MLIIIGGFLLVLGYATGIRGFKSIWTVVILSIFSIIIVEWGPEFHAVGDGAVPSQAVVEPVGDASDGGGRNGQAAGDGLVRFSLGEEFNDLPAIGKIAKLGDGQKVAEESHRLISILESEHSRKQFLHRE